MNDNDGGYLPTELQKGGGIHAFLGCIMAEAAPVPGLEDIMLLGVDRDGGLHILHSLFSVPVGSYDPVRQLFRCCRELPSEGLPQSRIFLWLPSRHSALSVPCRGKTT